VTIDVRGREREKGGEEERGERERERERVISSYNTNYSRTLLLYRENL